MNKIVCCFGELLLRLSPALDRQWIHSASMPVFVGGAELNVATALAKWDVPVEYSTALPDNYLSREICEHIAQKNIGIRPIHFSGERIGTYYLPQGTDLKNGGVIYDRKYSSFGSLKPGMIDWDEVLRNVRWFHFSAISPALTEEVAAVCREGAAAAAAKGITVSIDLNYRASLWKYGKKPSEIMPSLVEFCDVVMGNIWAANSLLGLHVDPEIHLHGNQQDFLAHASRTAIAMHKRFPKVKTVANTFRFDQGDGGILYYAALDTGGQQYHSTELLASKIVDKVGSGDCFMAGLIYGLYHKHAPQEVIETAANAAFGKLMEKGDATNQTMESIKQRISAHG